MPQIGSYKVIFWLLYLDNLMYQWTLIKIFQNLVTVILEYVDLLPLLPSQGAVNTTFTMLLCNSIVYHAKYAEFQLFWQSMHKNCTYYADIMLNALPIPVIPQIVLV